MTSLTFTSRRLEKFVVKRIEKHGEEYHQLISTEGGGISVPSHVTQAIKEGEIYYLELFKFNDIAGLMKEDGEYLFHRSDDYFIRKRAEYLAESEAKREKMYLDNHEDWHQRTQALPDRYRTRLERFLAQDTNDDFRKGFMGWGYELTICELAVMYEASGIEDDETVMDYAKLHGTSGNQHDCAKAWAANPDVAI